MELDGRYRLDRLVGNGATAEIWRGYDALLRRPVAIRLLRPDRPGRAQEFLAAGRTAARLTHPNVAAVYDVGVAVLPLRGATPFVVMELADGPSLAARLAAGPLAWPEAARIGAEVAAALAEAHGRWVSHGTLVPAKVVLTDVGAKVIGFAADMLADPDGASADVRALGALLAACFDDRPGHRPPAELTALASRCLSPEPALRPSSDEAALTLARIAGATVDLPAFLTAGLTAGLTGGAETRVDATVPLRGQPRTRRRMRWTARAVVASAGAAALLLGAVAALGQVGPGGGMPWFSHPADVAAVPPVDDRPCADAALDPRACVPAAVPSHPAATTIVPVPRPTSRSPKPSVSRTTGPASSPSPSSASATPSPSPSTSTSVSPPESSAPPSPPVTPSHSESPSSPPSGIETASDSPATH
ncbi:protein kinase [Dactylosporangium sp. NPDC051484]|uniref:protein kinase n=1 Tax=Dactylosporangium sp. NPDC051484 TaxID=3154942 RepID=UPI00345015B2